VAGHFRQKIVQLRPKSAISRFAAKSRPGRDFADIRLVNLNAVMPPRRHRLTAGDVLRGASAAPLGV
jgi:hypothetical protein